MEKIKKIQVENIFSTDIHKDILLSIYNRKSFSFNEGLLIVPTFFSRIIGIENTSENEYYNGLFQLDQRLSSSDFAYNRIDYRLDTRISEDKIKNLNSIWKEIKADDNLRGTFIARNLYGSGIIEKTRRNEFDILIRDAFEITLESFINAHSKNKNPSIIKNFCIKIIHWFETYALKDFHSCKFNKDNPKTLFYGDITRDEVYFMLFLSKIGYDVLYFNPQSDSHFTEANFRQSYCSKLEFNLKRPIKAFPKGESIVQVQTAAFRAERSVENLLQGEDFDFSRPWQFENYKTKSIPLKTTFNEMYRFWETEAKKREGFRITENTVFIPNIFTKINGTNKNINEYWADVIKLAKFDMLFAIFKLPFSKVATKTFDYRGLLNQAGLFDISKVKSCSDFKLSYLKQSLQNLIVEKANEMIEKKHFITDIDVNFKIRIMATILNMDNEILKLLQRFDYPFNVPKILVYHNSNSQFSVEDCISIAFLNAVGVDIIILTPTGYSNIENIIKNDLFDVHSLEEMRFDLEISKDVKKEIGTKQKEDAGSFANKIFKIFFTT